MLLFIIIVSVLVLLALLFVVPALFKPSRLQEENYDQQNLRIARDRLAELKRERDAGSLSEEEFNQVRDELEKTLALDLSVASAATSEAPAQSGRVLGLILLAAVPIVSALMYWQLGSFSALNGETASHAGGQKIPGMNMTMDEAIAGLKNKLEQDPNNPQGWFMLARSYMAIGDYAKGVEAYKKTMSLVGDDAELMLRYADALVMQQGGRFAGEATDVINKALSLAPEHPQGLWLAGMAAAEAGDFRQALTHWYKLEPMLDQDIDAQTEVRGMIANAESQLDPATTKSLKKSLGVKKPPAVAATSSANITVKVTLADALKGKVKPDDTLFVLARAIEGPPMPLAVVKMQVRDLPLTVQLNDAMAMMPQMKLSNFPEVRVTAMIPKSGMAKLDAGDLFGERSPVKTSSAQPLSIVIDQVK
jgi:cytochrome c-type biogenesis protein CcmH